MKKITLTTALLLMVSASALFAGGPLLIFDELTRSPYAYPPGVVNVYTDLGPNGLLTNAQSDAHTAAGYAEWTGVGSAYFSAAVAGDFTSVGLPDVDGFNAGLVVGTFNGSGIHVMYDNDGTIVSNFFGAPPGVLGIASPEWSTTGTPDLLESWVVLNGTEVDPGDVGGATFAGVFTHEFGHTINLAHTQTNGAAGFFGDSNGPDACGTPYSDPQTISDFETMYPFLDTTPGSTGMYQAVVDHLDDIAAVSDVYPDAGWPATHGTISGIVYAPDGVTELTGINVIARNVADPYRDANSALSGDWTQGYLGPDGLFTLNGLTPGAQYVVYIDEIVAGGFSTDPGTIPGDGNEEYWNTNENVDPSIDDPCDYTFIVPTAGVTDNADIIVNGDPNNLDLGDDDYIELALPFSFPFCGQSFNSVFVCSNGYLTFGVGDMDYSESVGDFLDGPPRIAMLWDDLNPTAGGTITAEVVGADFVVHYNNIPEFYSTGSNSFDVTLRADGSFNVDYGTITAPDGIAGRTLGGGAVDPGEVDLTLEPQPIGTLSPTVYEDFVAGYDNDLDGEFLAYAPCVIPDPPEIVVNPRSLSAILCTGESTTKQLKISNLGDLDLDFNIVTNQDLGGPASGGVIPKVDMGSGGGPVDLDGARLAKLNDDMAGSDPGKPEISPLIVPLPHVFALSLLMENFDAGFPAGWTAIDNEGNGVIWQVPAQGGGNYTGGTGDAAGANSDWVGPADYDTELRTPPISGFGPNVVLSYTANYQNYANWDYLDVDVSVDGGTNWTTVLSWNEDHGGFFGPPGEQVALDLDPFVAGYPEFIVRWHWYDPTTTGDWDWYVQIDDVMVVSDEPLVPCGFISAVAPDAGTIPGDGTQNIDVTFDATGYLPGYYDCELIIFSNAINEPRYVVPLHLTVAIEAALDIKPGSCPNPINRHLFDLPEDGMARKGGVLPVALAGDADFDVGDVDRATILLAGVAPLSKGGGPEYDDVATPYDNAQCDCIEAEGDGIMDISMKFQSQEIAEAIGRQSHRTTAVLTMTGRMNDGTMFIARDCITFVGNYPDDDPLPVISNDDLGPATPNPFNPTTTISYSIALTGQVKLTVFDVRGRVIERLVDGVVGAGDHSVTWDAKGMPSGIYFYRLETANFKETRKLVLLK